jgi:2-phosphosulfolactate phosphatase
MQTIEVSFSPALYEYKLTKDNFITVITDILRATTSVCAALEHGVSSVIPVAGIEIAREYKKKGYLVACERDGKILDFADMGNSPSDFLKDDYKGKEIVFSTTNGTQSVLRANDSDMIVLGSFVNLGALAEWLISRGKNIVIFCAAWKNLFNIEDSVFAGALAEKLLDSGKFMSDCDSVKAALDLWHTAKPDLYGYLSESSHRNRLKHLVSESDFEYTVSIDSTRVIPVLIDGHFENLNH